MLQNLPPNMAPHSLFTTKNICVRVAVRQSMRSGQAMLFMQPRPSSVVQWPAWRTKKDYYLMSQPVENYTPFFTREFLPVVAFCTVTTSLSMNFVWRLLQALTTSLSTVLMKLIESKNCTPTDCPLCEFNCASPQAFMCTLTNTCPRVRMIQSSASI